MSSATEVRTISLRIARMVVSENAADEDLAFTLAYLHGQRCMTDLDHEPVDESSGHPDPSRLLVEMSPVAMGKVDLATGSLTFVNDRWRQITGIQQATPIPFEALQRTLHPDDRPSVAAA